MKHGADVEDWLVAEQELVLHVREDLLGEVVDPGRRA